MGTFILKHSCQRRMARISSHNPLSNRSIYMKPLALKLILSQLNEAHGELSCLFARTQFVVFGEVLDEDVKDWEEAVALEEQREPLSEETFSSTLSRVYRHLNVAWNGRHASETRISGNKPVDIARWSRFPTSALFRDLQPAPNLCDGVIVETARRSFHPTSLQAAFLQVAVRKLTILRYRVSCALGDGVPEKVPRPKGLFPEVDSEPFTEAVFGRRMHRVYRELETAWTYREKRLCLPEHGAGSHRHGSRSKPPQRPWPVLERCRKPFHPRTIDRHA